MNRYTLLFTLLLLVSPASQAQMSGVIHDPDGYTNLRARPDLKAAVVAKVQEGEVFEFDVPNPGDEFPAWVKVKLASGKTGYMHSSRVMFHADIKDLQGAGPEDEVHLIAKRHGFDYFTTARAAAKGDAQALQTLFSLGIPDGGWGEPHIAHVSTIIHILGDDRFATFCKAQTPELREMIRETLVSGISLYPFKDEEYMKRHFPKSTAVFMKSGS